MRLTLAEPNYLKDSISNEHIVLNLFFKRSLFIPTHIRAIRTIGLASMMFFMNSLFYSDDKIEKRNKLELSEEVR